MARVIPFDELAAMPNNTPVWMEWAFDADDVIAMTKECTKYTAKGAPAIYFRSDLSGNGTVRLMFTEDVDVRFWDAETTDEERRGTPWWSSLAGS